MTEGQDMPQDMGAVERLRKLLADAIGKDVRLDASVARPWQSLTFVGAQTEASFWADCPPKHPQLLAALNALDDMDLAGGEGEIVADLAVTTYPEHALRGGGCCFSISVLTVQE